MKTKRQIPPSIPRLADIKLSEDELCSITDMTDRRHRQLAKAGHFPDPVKCQYALVPTLAGIVKYLREGTARLNALKEKQMEEDIKLTKAEASIKQMEEARIRGDTMVTVEVDAKINECFLPVRQRLDCLPSEMASRCNPSDPTLARQALQQWLTEFFAQIQEKLPKTQEPKPQVKKSK